MLSIIQLHFMKQMKNIVAILSTNGKMQEKTSLKIKRFTVFHAFFFSVIRQPSELCSLSAMDNLLHSKDRASGFHSIEE